MRPGGGKQKGAAFERVVCSQLSQWLTDGKRKDLFWRSAMSGGRATVHVRKGQSIRQSGDITAVAPEGHILTNVFFIECKHVRDLMIDRFFLEDAGVLAKFWKHARAEARKHNRLPMIVAKQNGYPVIFIMPRRMSTRCASWLGECTVGLFDKLMEGDTKWLHDLQ